MKAYIFYFNEASKFLADTTDYAQCEALEGFILYDEPSAKKFDEIASLIPEFEKRLQEFMDEGSYYAVLEATNHHDYQRADVKDAETWTAINPNKVWEN